MTSSLARFLAVLIAATGLLYCCGAARGATITPGEDIMRIALLALPTPMTVKGPSLPLYIGVTTSDPSRSAGPLVALDWLQGTPLGNATAAIVIFAAALLVFTILTGGINRRLVVTVVLGCLLLLASAAIVSGTQSATALAR